MSTADGTRKFWTTSGKYVDPLDLQPEDIDIGDIAQALSNKCRFAGHLKSFYSVAQHAVLVSLCLEEEDKLPETVLWGLLHDSAEAYLGDIIAPLKPYVSIDKAEGGILPDFYSYECVEDSALLVIAKAFSLSHIIPADVWVADRRVLTFEGREIVKTGDWNLGVKAYVPKIKYRDPLPPVAAKHLFLRRFKDLTNR